MCPARAERKVRTWQFGDERLCSAVAMSIKTEKFEVHIDMADYIATLTATRIPKERRKLDNDTVTNAEHGVLRMPAGQTNAARADIPSVSARGTLGRSQGSGLDLVPTNHQGNTSTEMAQTDLQAAEPGRGMRARCL